MARLREVRVEASALVSDRGMVAPGFLFRETTHHVVSILEEFLPRDFTLDGSSVVQLTLGPRREIDPEHLQALGATEIYVESFDFAAYHAMSSRQREVQILELTEDRLLYLASMHGADSKPIVEAAAAVRQHGFMLEMERTKLARSLPGRKGRIRVYRQLASGYAERWLARLLDQAGRQVHEVVLKERGPVDWRGHFHHSELAQDTFMLKDDLDRPTLSITCVGELVADSSADAQRYETPSVRPPEVSVRLWPIADVGRAAVLISSLPIMTPLDGEETSLAVIGWQRGRRSSSRAMEHDPHEAPARFHPHLLRGCRSSDIRLQGHREDGSGCHVREVHVSRRER
ncbi:hypothetical protein [Lysobacter auxotrophicus]|uniref:Uncharacterized protein n=1 Tax=Lysobacter auxotrophicus TaxID=2992573 RepID=A0ABM8DDJ1_9GAMM|nr:hypothetical protein [Lysobacter auxotrophicus]BDU16665.1 hypothetical protein LA521A_18660 [Lysobacter auxotrophicus]